MTANARQRAAIAIGSLLMAAVFWSPAWRHVDATGFGDWQMVHHNWEVGFIALTRFRQWPLWNPFFCGGITAFGNPESQWFSPLVWISLLTGTTIGTKFFLTLHAAIGLSGMFVFTHGELGLRRSAALLSSVAWACSGFFAWHGAGGHATFLPFYFAPWLLLCVRRAGHDLRYAIAASVWLALTLYEGGTYPFPYFVLWLVIDGLLQAPTFLRDRSRAQAMFKAVLVMALLTALLGAVRLLPIADSLAQLPRDTTDDDAIALTEIVEMLTAREHPWRYPPHRFVWPEYGTFVGWTVLVFAALGMLASLVRRHWVWPIGLAVFVAFVMGEGGPWSLLHHLPVFDSLRVPSRFMVLVTFYLAVLAGLGLDALIQFLETHRTTATLGWLRHALIPLFLVIVVSDLLVVNLQTINRWNGPPIVSGPMAERFHLLRARNFHDLYASLPARNLGIAGCYNGGMNWQVSPALWTGDVPQARVEPPDAGQLLAWSRTSNTIQLNVRADREPTRLVLNQNYDRDVIASLGTVIEDRGRLALDLPAGQHTIELRYTPRTLLWGLLLSALGWVLAFAGLRLLPRYPRTLSTGPA